MIFTKLFSKTPRIAIEPLRWEAGDPLAAEHELVSQLVAETFNGGVSIMTGHHLKLFTRIRPVTADTSLGIVPCD